MPASLLASVILALNEINSWISEVLKEVLGWGWKVGDSLGHCRGGQSEGELDPGCVAERAGVWLGFQSLALDPGLAERAPVNPRLGWDPAQATAGFPGLGAADGAERSAAGGAGGEGGWSREVRRVCGAFLYLLLWSLAAVAATAIPATFCLWSRDPDSATASQHVGDQEAEDGRLGVFCLPSPPPFLRAARHPLLPPRFPPSLQEASGAARGSSAGRE
jgi:hypothetical protein